MNIAVMHSDRFGNVQELRFETDMGCANLLEGRFDDAPESNSQGSKFRIWAANRSISYFSEIAFSGCKMFKYEQCHAARSSICWCSGIAFSGFETVRYGQRYVARWSFCWYSEIALSGCHTFKYGQCCLAMRSISFFSEIAFSGC